MAWRSISATRAPSPAGHKDDYGFAGLLFRNRFRQLHILGVRQHLDIAGIHEQEEHENRKNIHQRHKIERHTFLVTKVVAIHARSAAHIIHD
jgi:hypothetical protein